MNNINFSDRILTRIESQKDPLPLLKDWTAKSPSRYPATENDLKSWLPHYRSAREAKMILFLGLYRPEWVNWEITARIRNSAYFQRYSGEWEQVQQMLEQVTDFKTFEDYIQNHESFDDFFGNFLKDCEKFLRRNPFPFKPVERDRHKTRKPVYRRGYRDKGSLRPYHQRGRNLGEPNSGEDRRSKVKYSHLPDI